MGSMRIVDPRVDPDWATLSARGSLFSSPRWLRALADTYGFDVKAALYANAESPSAGVPFALIEDALGTRVSSLAFSDYCDPIGADAASWPLLADAILAAEAPVRLRCLHAEAPLADPRFELVGEAAWHAVDITRDAEEIWASISGAARRGIRKARAREVTVRVADDTASIELFHSLHSQVRSRKYRLLAQPLAFFERLRAEFASSGDLAVLIAEADGVAVAATLFLVWQDTLYYKFNASRADALDVRPNDLLIWSGIEHGKRLGLSRLDFGLSDFDQPGLISFKEKYATESGRISALSDKGPHERPLHAEDVRAILSELTELFTDEGVPAELTRLAGERLYRYFA